MTLIPVNLHLLRAALAAGQVQPLGCCKIWFELVLNISRVAFF